MKDIKSLQNIISYEKAQFNVSISIFKFICISCIIVIKIYSPIIDYRKTIFQLTLYMPIIILQNVGSYLLKHFHKFVVVVINVLQFFFLFKKTISMRNNVLFSTFTLP